MLQSLYKIHEVILLQQRYMRKIQVLLFLFWICLGMVISSTTYASSLEIFDNEGTAVENSLLTSSFCDATAISKGPQLKPYSFHVNLADVEAIEISETRNEIRWIGKDIIVERWYPQEDSLLQGRINWLTFYNPSIQKYPLQFIQCDLHIFLRMIRI